MIELMIGLVILGALVVLGIPSMRDYLTNSKILALAQSYQAALQKARSHAVLLNTPVDVVLTAASAEPANVAAAASAAGPNWIVRVQPNANAQTSLTNPPSVLPTAFVFVEGKNSAEGSSSSSTGAVVINSDVGTYGGVTYAAATTVTFTGLSNAPALGTTAAVSFTAPTCAPAGPIRCLLVVVSPGGQSKVCDPAATTAGDTRSCT